MNKTVLFLINGLGIEHQESLDIYSKEVMPVMDSCAVSEYFTKIETKAYNYSTGYQIFSTGNTDALAFPFVDKIVDDNSWNNNEVYKSLTTKLQSSESGKLHIFCFLDSPRIAEHLKSFITSLNTEKEIWVHPIMTSPKMEGYKGISKNLYKINYETFPNVKIGTVFGNNIITDESKTNEFNDLGRVLFRGSGEKWTDMEQKISSLQAFKIVPNDAKVFCVNEQFQLKTNDIIFFYNYDAASCSRFIELINNPPRFFNSQVEPNTLQYYSLFPLENTSGVANLYGNVTSEFSMMKALKQVNAKALVLVDKENLNTVNFMANGMTQVGDGTIEYALTDSGLLFNEAQMKSVLENEKYQLIIINHRIDQYQDEQTMKNALTQIDQNLNMIKNLCQDKYSLIISSLFGIKKEIRDKNGKEGVVDFSNVVPVIIVDSRYDKKQYTILPGNLNTVLATALKLISPSANIPTMLKKKGFIQKILFK